MLRSPRELSRARRCVRLWLEVLECRELLTSGWLAIQVQGATKEEVSLAVPSTYISQSATEIDLTIARSMGSKQAAIKTSQTLDVRAVALTPATTKGGNPHTSGEIAPVNDLVTFQPGQMSQTVELPIVVQTPLPSLVPVEITVAPKVRPRNQAVLMVDLASAQQLVPPTITNVRIVRKDSLGTGIAVTFSQPMDPASVEDIFNYSVRSVPLNQLTLLTAPSASVVQNPSELTTFSPESIPIKAARYNPATDTVLLVPRKPLTVAKSFIVRSPTSLGDLRSGPRVAHPLTDANGNVLNPLNFPEGYFDITINPK